MAEFHFYGSDIDTFDILDEMTRHGDIQLVPAIKYPSTEPDVYRTITDDLLNALSTTPHLYITGAFSVAPLRLRRITIQKQDAAYIVDHRSEKSRGTLYGGPALSMHIPLTVKNSSGIVNLLPGFIFRHRQFYDDKTGVSYRPPDDFRLAYDDIVRRIKKTAKRHRIGDHSVWIGPDGLDLVSRGEALILVRGTWVDRDGAVVATNVRGSDDRSRGNWA